MRKRPPASPRQGCEAVLQPGNVGYPRTSVGSLPGELQEPGWGSRARQLEPTESQGASCSRKSSSKSSPKPGGASSEEEGGRKWWLVRWWSRTFGAAMGASGLRGSGGLWWYAVSQAKTPLYCPGAKLGRWSQGEGEGGKVWSKKAVVRVVEWSRKWYAESLEFGRLVVFAGRSCAPDDAGAAACPGRGEALIRRTPCLPAGPCWGPGVAS